MPNWKKVIVSGSDASLNSLNVVAGVTGSLFGTASFAQTANTASYVLNAVSASYALSSSNAATASYILQAVSASFATNAANATTASYVQNAASASYALSASYAPTITYTFNNGISDVGSNTIRLGGALITNTTIDGNFSLTRTADRAGSTFIISNPNALGTGLTVNGTSVAIAASGSVNVTGSVSSTLFGFTGSLQGTASWAQNVVSASYALSASYVPGGSSISASYAATASVLLGSVTSASYAATSSYAFNSITASYGNATSTVGFNIGGTQIYYAVTSSLTTPSTTSVFSTNTGSFFSAFYNYALYSGSNSRAGQVIASWISGSVQYTDFSTIDIGSTLTVTASVAIVTGQAQLNFTVPTSTAGWNIKATATYL